MNETHEHHTAEDLRHELEEHDEWFRHDASEPHHQESHGETNPYLIGAYLIATVVLVFGLAGVLVTYFKQEILQAHEAREAESDRNRMTAEIRGLRATWGEQLSGYSWIDAQEGDVGLPIERSVELVIRDYNEGAYSEER